jgi:hypothetical protein
MLTRARVVVAGAIIAAVADLLLILLCGYNDDTTQRAERGDYHNGAHCTAAKLCSRSCSSQGACGVQSGIAVKGTC